MTEPTKEQLEKWRSEFENDKNLWPSHPMDYGYVITVNLFSKNTNGEYIWSETKLKWKCYLFAKKSDFEEISNERKLSYKYYGESEQLKIDKKYLEQQLLQVKKETELLKHEYRESLDYLASNKWTSKTLVSVEMERLENKRIRDRFSYEKSVLEQELQKTREQLNLANEVILDLMQQHIGWNDNPVNAWNYTALSADEKADDYWSKYLKDKQGE